jgi:CRISPR-associated protein Cas4
VSWLYEHGGRRFIETIREAAGVDSQVTVLLILFICFAVLADSLLGFMKWARRRTGLTRGMKVRGVEGGSFVAGREYMSERLGLVGRPDAVVEENGYFVPIERKAFGKRPRDKDVAQLLVYCRLIEEESGVRPPHGYLIIGPQAKRCKVINSAEKQLWIDTILEQMRSVLVGGSCVATPQRKKCEACAVRVSCAQRIC